MALTAKQRRRLPPSAFAYPKRRAYPVPTKGQARKAGIPEGQRQRMLRNAASRAAQPGTSGTFGHVARLARQRAGGPVGKWPSAAKTGRQPTTRRVPR